MIVRAVLLGLAVMICAIGALSVVAPPVMTGVVVSKVAKTYEKAGFNTSKCKEQFLPQGGCLEQPMSDIAARLPGGKDLVERRSRDEDE